MGPRRKKEGILDIAVNIPCLSALDAINVDIPYRISRIACHIKQISR